MFRRTANIRFLDRRSAVGFLFPRRSAVAHPKFRVARFTAVSVALAVAFFVTYAAPSAQQAPAAPQAAPAGAKGICQ